MLNYKKDNEKGKIAVIALFLKRHVVAVIALILILIGGIWSAFILTGNKAGTGNEANNVKMEDASVIYLAMPPAASYDPLRTDDYYVMGLCQLLYRSLYQLDSTLNVKEDMVETYTADAASGTVTIKLKDKLTYSDGSVQTAGDVRFTVDEIKKAGAASPYYNYVSKIKDVDVEDSQNLIIQFASPSDASIDNLIFPIVSSKDYKAGASFSKGSGPYAIDTVDDKKIALKINDQYLGEKAKLPIEVSIVGDPQLYPGLISMEAVTAGFFMDNKAKTQGKSKDLEVKSFPSSQLEYVGFNYSGTSLMSRSEMRQAVGFAIDRKQLVEDNYAGDGTVSETLYYPNFLNTKKEEESYNIKYNPKEAIKKMKSAGLNDSNDDGILEKSDGSPASVKLLVSKDYPSRADAAAQIQETLSKLGLNTTIESVSTEEFWKKIAASDYDIFVSGMTFDKQFKMQEMLGTGNYFGFVNKDVDQKVAVLETSLNAEEQKKAFLDLKKALYQQMPYVPICYNDDYFLSVKSLKGEEFPSFFSPYDGANTWTWQRKMKNTGK